MIEMKATMALALSLGLALASCGGRSPAGKAGMKEDGRIFLENVSQNAGRYKADVTVWYFDEEGVKVETKREEGGVQGDT